LFTIRANHPNFPGVNFFVAPDALVNCDPQILLVVKTDPRKSASPFISAGTRFYRRSMDKTSGKNPELQ
jgi:hypothetical protein